jgi:hypothetical protein
MDVGPIKYGDKYEKEAKEQEEYMKDKVCGKYKKINFNLLRIEEPFLKKLEKADRVLKMAPIIAYSSEEPFGKYDVVETELEAYTHDERDYKDEDEADFRKYLFEDSEPTQLSFKPFKYVVFKIPLFRYPVVDMMTIFVPLWLLSFLSIYIYFQSTEIMNRIVNVAGLMIAYAAIQPIVRDNLPEATTITLVDILIYTELLINILFLIRSVDVRDYYDSPPATTYPFLLNTDYDRWNDGLYIASLIIAIANVIIVVVLIIIYLVKKSGYKAAPLPRSVFSISNRENWSLTLIQERAFARYKETLTFLD